jgi:redox-sensing transcriptional repressor
MGDLGRAVAHYGGFLDRGFRIVAIFDNDPAKIGKEVGGLPILGTHGIEGEIRRRGIRVAMLAVPAAAAQAQPMSSSSGVQAICAPPTGSRPGASGETIDR